ncbi:MAG: hypothetical protein EZS28_044217 [Streblomastix strix]|uniref:Uncharacterized protein n=1 Tax=Streblomastix strix TaxID=222440 RepID=A0A5J4TP45_9EUKA|nr:MAG: hypothetical protein EZS28_044217 [Streblomastix strix]
MVDLQDTKKFEILVEMEHFSRDSSQRCSPVVSSDSGIENGRSSKACDLLKRQEALWSNNRREMEIISQGLHFFEPCFILQEAKAIMIRLDNCSKVSNLRSLKAAPQLLCLKSFLDLLANKQNTILPHYLAVDLNNSKSQLTGTSKVEYFQISEQTAAFGSEYDSQVIQLITIKARSLHNDYVAD